MIKHIVCFKLADPTPANCQKAAKVLRSMDGKIPLLRGIEVGVDELRSGRSYDVILQVLLDDMAALDAYQQDPYHCGVVKNRTICHFLPFFIVEIDKKLVPFLPLCRKYVAVTALH